MPRLNQSQFALLGLLSLGEMSGYDLKQLSGWSVAHFWREGYGQIYPGLKKMAAAGLVRCRTKKTAGRPDRNIYALTAAGRGELTEWLRRPAADEVPRNELLLKLFFGGLSPLTVSSEHVLERRRSGEKALAEYALTRKRIEKEQGKHPQKPFWLMTLSYGECLERAVMEWCDGTLAALRNVATSDTAGSEKTGSERRKSEAKPVRKKPVKTRKSTR